MVAFFYSCKKNGVTSFTDEYIHYDINGVPCNFDMPADSVFADSVKEASSFLDNKSVYGRRLAPNTTDITRITYDKTNAAITAGSQATLLFLYTPQTSFFPQAVNTAAPIIINFTEAGAVNQYIAGNFSATFTAPSPANTVYNVSCKFRFRRRI